MYCPRCGQQQQNRNTRFCSRCRFVLAGMSEVIENGGLPKEILERSDPNAISPRKRGVKQGGLLMLSSLILVPLLGIFSEIFNIEPALVAVTAIITFWGGFLRIIYALIFQSNVPTLSQNEGFIESVKQNLTGKTNVPNALPPQQSEPISTAYQPPSGNWRETADLQPTSVTEETTRTLNNKKHL